MIEYQPDEPCAGVRPVYHLLDQNLFNHFASCRGGTPEAPLVDWAWSILGSSDGLFIDIGAHVGSWALPFACAGMPTVAFEPNWRIFELLVGALDANNLSNISVHSAALSANPGSGVLTAPGIDGGMASIVIRFNNPAVDEQVSVTTLDEFDLQPTVIKIDVEGAEVDVLRGAAQTIARCKPVIFFECWEDERGQRIPELFSYVREIGYDPLKTEWPEIWMAVPQ